jgi:paraquat-inducible protein B
MAKRISSTAIGAFVLGSLAILVAALVVVGSGQLFARPVKFVCMFQGNLNGLKVGAPVKVRGVETGKVVAIKLKLSPTEGRLRPGLKEIRLPVLVELDRSQVVALGGTGEALRRQGYEEMLQRGLRAQLSVDSLLTGLLYIDLDFHPNSPADLVLVPDSGPYREIPTIPTKLQEFQEQTTKILAQLQKLDLQSMASAITQAAGSINELASSDRLKDALNSLTDATAQLDRTALAAQRAIRDASQQLAPLSSDLLKTSTQMTLTLQQARLALLAMQATLGPDAPLSVHLNRALDQFAEASKSLQELTDYLRRNPSSLIRGRYAPDRHP